MVRLYLPPRFSKRRLGDGVARKALACFGGLGLFRHTKVIHSTACLLGSRGELFTVNLQAGAPGCPADLWVLQFLRTYVDCIVTTGKILRTEPAAFDTSVIKSVGLDPRVYFENPKPVAVMTNTVSEALLRAGNRVYADQRFRKHLLTTPAALRQRLGREQLSRANCTLDPVEGLDLNKAVAHLRAEYGYEMMLVECGPSTTAPCYGVRGGSPIDTLYLGIFEGELPSDAPCGAVGEPFATLQQLRTRYELVHEGAPDPHVHNFAGTFRRTFWRRKSAEELQ